jgi:murein DD-endopeptidase MepM/ murein hydrolase activator NlpD
LNKINQILLICLLPISSFATVSNNTMFVFKGINYQIPLENMNIEEFLDRSIGYIPRYLIQDGLPHFGSKRDDWKRQTRKHKGYDIYINHINVIAAADGIVTKVRKTSRAGLYVKLLHPAQVYTLYIHLTRAKVKRGQRVKRGQIIGRIDAASGNAMEPQLHFEIKPYNNSINPLPLIENSYYNNNLIIKKIHDYKQLIRTNIRIRNIAVRNYLISK